MTNAGDVVRLELFRCPHCGVLIKLTDYIQGERGDD